MRYLGPGAAALRPDDATIRWARREQARLARARGKHDLANAMEELVNTDRYSHLGEGQALLERLHERGLCTNLGWVKLSVDAPDYLSEPEQPDTIPAPPPEAPAATVLRLLDELRPALDALDPDDVRDVLSAVRVRDAAQEWLARPDVRD